MQRSIIDLPARYQRDLVFNWDIDWRGSPPSDNTAGTQQIVYNNFPRWVGQPSYFIKPEEVGPLRALRALVQGRKNIWRIKLGDLAVFNPTTEGFPAGIYWDDDTSWDNDILWKYEPFFVLSVAASAGATKIIVDISGEGVVPKIGQIISCNDYPYIVTYVTVDPENSNLVTLGIQTPLRESLPVNSEFKYIATGLFIAVTDTTGNPSYDGVGFSKPSFQFVEYLR